MDLNILYLVVLQGNCVCIEMRRFCFDFFNRTLILPLGPLRIYEVIDFLFVTVQGGLLFLVVFVLGGLAIKYYHNGQLYE